MFPFKNKKLQQVHGIITIFCRNFSGERGKLEDVTFRFLLLIRRKEEKKYNKKKIKIKGKVVQKSNT